MWWWFASSLALAVPPDGTPARLDVGAGKIERLVLSEDGGLLVGRSRAELDAWLMDVEDWSIRRFDPCGEVTGVALAPSDDGGHEIWVACGDGTIRGQVYADGELTDITDDDGVAVVVQVADSLSGIWYHEQSGAGLLYAVSVATTPATLHVVDPNSGVFPVDSAALGGFPVALPWSNFVEGLVNNGTLFIAHRSHEVSRVQLGVATPPTVPSVLALSINVKDIAPSLNGGFYAVDEAGILAEFSAISNQFALLLNGLVSPKAVTASEDANDPWILVTGQEIKIWEMSNGGISDPTPIFEIPDADNNIQDSVARDSYVFGGGEGGNIHVTTARPWVYPARLTADPMSATDGDLVTVELQVDESSDWALYRGGDRTGSGVRLANGSAAADEQVSVEVDVDLDWEEGDNHLYAVATNGRGLTGHARVSVAVDNPPKPPTLTDDNVGFADGALLLGFEGISDADLEHYDVYVSQTPFDAGQYGDDDGPAWDGQTELETPIVVQSTGGARVDVRIQPLENYTTYYIAVRATDQGGLVGPLSNVVKGRPRPSFTAGELADERGGTPCSTGGTGPLGGLGGLAVLAMAAVRRRSTGALAALLGIAVLLGSATAHAQDRGREPWRDMTPQRGNFELRYGVVNFLPQPNGSDNPIDTVYKENPHNILQMEFGPQIGRVLEFDLGVGFFQELAQRVDLQGRQSSDRTMLTWFPFLTSVTGRIHIVDEQLIVPFARYGFDYVIYSELTDDGAGGKDKLQGAKLGHHWALGINLLLDTIHHGRASLLEAQTGINDSYLVIEFRRQNIDTRRYPWGQPVKRGLDFTASMVTVGFKLDY